MNENKKDNVSISVNSKSNSINDIIDLILTPNKSTKTLKDSVDENMERISTIIKDSKTINDAYGNSLLSVGTDDKVTSFDTYSWSNDTLNYVLWLSLYNDSWVFKRAIDKPAQDCIRCGIDIQNLEDSELIAINKLVKNARFDLIQLLQWGRLFGGSVCVTLLDNMHDEDYAYPMNKEIVKKCKQIRYYVTDRWFGCQPSTDNIVDDMNDIDFGKPKYYQITFADGKTIKCHHDWVIRYENRTAPKLVKTGQLQGWGYAEGSHILQILEKNDKLESSIQSLINKSLIEVIKMPGMRGVFMGQDDGSVTQLKQRLEMVNWGRNFNSLTFLDKDDEYSEHGFSGLGGLSDLLEKNMWQIAAALEMQGILFGDLKGGFSNDTEALERYDETINGLCESYVRPVYEKLLKLFYAKLGIEKVCEFEFKSLLKKQHDEKNIDNLQKFVDLGTKLLDSGIIDLVQFGQAINKYSKQNIIDFGLTDDKIEDLKNKQKEEDEVFNLDEV